MENPLARYISLEGHVDDDFLEHLAFNEKMAELGRLSAGLVHELNTPLSVIVSAAQLIMREEELSESVREMVERIGMEAQRLSLLAKGVLSFSRQDETAPVETDVNALLLEVLAFLRYEAQKRSVAVCERLDYSVPSIAAGGNRLKQAFINLIMNAVQAMEEGGALTVETRRSGSGVLVRICDTGKGIPEGVVGRIFEPFFTTKAPGAGTGLGLFITSNIIESLGGSISVESHMGTGTTFSLLLPAKAQS